MLIPAFRRLPSLVYSASFVWSLFSCNPAALAQSGQNCKQINQAATSNFDFTEGLSRWGSFGAYDLDNIPHRVRSIAINTLPIFDESNPRENRKLYLWANEIHFNTLPDVIAEQLLFSKGSYVDSGMLAESERILRNRKYVGDAKIRVLQDCDNEVDLEVVTREVWSLSPELSFKSTGGHTKYSMGMRDSNILGTGQHVSLEYKSEQERNSYALGFNNPNIRGSRITFNSEIATNSDGHRYYLQTGLPFFALDDPRSWIINYESKREILTQYQLGARVSQIEHEYRSGEVAYGISAGRQQGWVHRYSTGLHVEMNQYKPGTSLIAPQVYPQDLDLNYPFLQFEAVEDNYALAYNIGQIYRTEDLHVGKYLRTRIGYDSGQSNRIILDGLYSDTLLYQPKMLLQFNADWNGRYNQTSQTLEDTILHARLDFHRGQTVNRTLFLGLEATRAINLNNGRQIVLGGSNGLRGFDTNFLTGNASVQFTAEQRVFTNYHFLQLFRVGFAAFFDVGKVYGNADPLTQGLHKNIGFGLRLAPSKSESGQIVHIDVAYPLDNKLPGGRNLQFIAELKKSF